ALDTQRKAVPHSSLSPPRRVTWPRRRLRGGSSQTSLFSTSPLPRRRVRPSQPCLRAWHSARGGKTAPSREPLAARRACYVLLSSPGGGGSATSPSGAG